MIVTEDNGKGIDAKEEISQRKTISPYDLTSTDNLGIVITPVQLMGENYEEWDRSMRMALQARNEFGLLMEL